MNNFIIELSTSVLDEDNWTYMDNLDDCSFFTDIKKIEKEDRDKVIASFVNSKDFNKVFLWDEKHNNIVYNGKINNIREGWHSTIIAELKAMNMENTFGCYVLNKIIQNCIFENVLFLLPDLYPYECVKPIELANWLSHLKGGTKIYIGCLAYYIR